MPSVMVSGNRAIAEMLIRRWTTPAGGLIDDPNFGYSVYYLISESVTASDLQLAQQAMQAEGKKDQRVVRCPVQLQLISGVLMVSAQPVTAAGPFSLVFSVAANNGEAEVNLIQVTPS